MNKRRALKILIAVAVLAPLGLGLVGFAGPVPRHDGPATAHFDGKRFFNTPSFDKNFGDFLRWQLDRDRGRWEKDLGGAPRPAVLPLVPYLDTLRWEDLLAEGRALIPRYAPEWTDHNASDPGIALIQLFAHLSEQLGYRRVVVFPA